MANSFNISVAPEIKALEDKIDIVDTVVDNIRSEDVTSLTGEINENQTLLVDVTNPALVEIISGIGLNGLAIGLIRTEDVISLNTQILTRQARSPFVDGYLDLDCSEWTTLVESTGKGTLHFIQVRCRLDESMLFKLEIDGVTYNEISYSSLIWSWTGLDIGEEYTKSKWKTVTDPFLYNLNFTSLLRVSAAPSNGSGKAAAHIFYTAET